MEEGKTGNPLGGDASPAPPGPAPPAAPGGRRAPPRADLGPAQPFPFRLVWVFYGAMAVLAVVWRALFDGSLPWAVPGADALPVAQRIGAGLAAGALGLTASWAWIATSPRAARLSAELARMIGPMGAGAAWGVAFASGFAEEILFRGALQPHLGWLLASVLFGAVHYLRGRDLWIWAVYATISGLGLGALFAWSGDVLAPAVAHTVLNGVQLSRLGRRNRARALSRRPASGP